MSLEQKITSDVDLETFAKLFDTAMSSDNPAVKRALKNLLMIAALVDSEQSGTPRTIGPLRKLVDDVKFLKNQVAQLSHEIQYTRKIGNMPSMPMFPGPQRNTETGSPPPEYWLGTSTIGTGINQL